MPADGTPADAEARRRTYERGWRASARYGRGDTETSPLEGADHRGEPPAWYDGYLDHAADRPKWSTCSTRPVALHGYSE